MPPTSRPGTSASARRADGAGAGRGLPERRRSGSHDRAPQSSASARSLAADLLARALPRARFPRKGGKVCGPLEILLADAERGSATAEHAADVRLSSHGNAATALRRHRQRGRGRARDRLGAVRKPGSRISGDRRLAVGACRARDPVVTIPADLDGARERALGAQTGTLRGQEKLMSVGLPNGLSELPGPLKRRL
jgi:hypothetical protein